MQDDGADFGAAPNTWRCIFAVQIMSLPTILSIQIIQFAEDSPGHFTSRGISSQVSSLTYLLVQY